MLRDYQQSLVELSGETPGNILLQADTGSGKTRVLAHIAKSKKNVICIAHRNILIKQISRELARHDVVHDIIATNHTRQLCIAEHRKIGVDKIGNSGCFVASIDTLLSRHSRGMLKVDIDLQWTIIVDEAHHMIDENKWGSLLKIFRNARVIGATATPCRLDQVSLARGKGGVFDTLIQAKELQQDSVKTLISRGFLCDFKAYSVPERLDVGKLKLGSVDYTHKSLNAETQRICYEMAGDAVKHYKRLASGKQALAFCVSIDIAHKTAQLFKNNGIAAAAIHSKMSSTDIARVFDFFERRLIQVLFNVDMIGEGVDVPEIEALIMLRKTASFGLYRQWCGRSLRPERGKKHAILIDHVGNIRTHGLPDLHIDWDLNNPLQAIKSNLMPCPKCLFLVKAWIDVCPECGENIGRTSENGRSIDVQYIDFSLVEIERNKIKQKFMQENTLLLKERPYRLAAGVLGDYIDEVRFWFADCLKSRLSFSELNLFFEKTADKYFWIENFKKSDISTDGFEKCFNVYKTWSENHEKQAR